MLGSPNSESEHKSYANYKFRTRVVQRLQAGRPSTFTKHILPCHKTTRDPPMDPYALDIHANTKVMTERPSTWTKRPICSTYPELLARSTTMDFMHPLTSKPVKRRAETCQLEAGRPTNFSVDAKQPPLPSREDQEHPQEGRHQTERIPGRPA